MTVLAPFLDPHGPLRLLTFSKPQYTGVANPSFDLGIMDLHFFFCQVICSRRGDVIVLNIPPDEMFSVRGGIDLTTVIRFFYFYFLFYCLAFL